jgi:hypothetical protein
MQTNIQWIFDQRTFLNQIICVLWMIKNPLIKYYTYSIKGYSLIKKHNLDIRLMNVR